MTVPMRVRRLPMMGLAVAAAGVALCLAGCSHQGASADEDERTSGTTAKAEVTLTRVTRADISQGLTLTGTAAALPNQDVKVSSLVPGRIASLKVAEGDRVHAGEVVATLDNRPYKDQLQQAEAAAAQAKASYENAKLSRTRNEDLFQRGIAARKDLEDARTQEAVAAAATRQADAALEIARLQGLLVQGPGQAGEKGFVKLDQAVVDDLSHVEETLRGRIGCLRQGVNLDLLH